MIKDMSTEETQGRNSSDWVYYVKGGGGTGEQALIGHSSEHGMAGEEWS